MHSRRMSVWSCLGAWLLDVALALVVAPRSAAAQVVGDSIGGTITDDTGGASASDPRQIQWGLRFGF